MNAASQTIDIPATTFDGRPFALRAFRFARPGATPLVLWEGFYQNGFFYDVISGSGSIANHMQAAGYDVWVINSRGNGGSTGTRYFASMDDFAAIDIPTVIAYVRNATGLKPIYVGHSQGGNTALMSMMGACKGQTGEVYLSDTEAESRQQSLQALVTLGSYLDFTFSKPSSMQQFVRNGVVLRLFGKQFRIISSNGILRLLKPLKRLPVPIPLALRLAMLNSRALRIILFPLTLILNGVSLMKTWEFLYHIPNVSRQARLNIFYRTMQSTYWGILYQYQQAVMFERMDSCDKRVNYSEHYGTVRLPISVVVMEYDTLADPVETRRVMFPKLGSANKFFTEWKGQGHEDFAMNPEYFHQLIAAIAPINAGGMP